MTNNTRDGHLGEQAGAPADDALPVLSTADAAIHVQENQDSNMNHTLIASEKTRTEDSNVKKSSPPIGTAHVEQTLPTGPNPNTQEKSAACLPDLLTRTQTEPAIGPASDASLPIVTLVEKEGLVLSITLLLTNGARHPFNIDQKYMKKREVDVEHDDPANMSLYKLKELILRDWRADWEAKPSCPEAIRLISFGKMLSDKSKLSDNGFKSGAPPSIVHMAIKPQDIMDEEYANKSHNNDDSKSRSPSCRCILM